MNWGILIFVVAAGFTLAGLVSAVHASGSGNQAEFRISFENPLAVGWSVFLCMFAGPYIVLKNATRYWVQGLLPISILAFCSLLAGVWSFCSGIFVVEFLRFSGLITV